MKKSKIGILSVIGILVLVVMASGCTSSNNNTTSSNPQGQSTANGSSIPGASVKVISSGPWTGAISDSSGTRSVEGSGSQTFQLAANHGSVAVNFQKDNSKEVGPNGTITPDTSTLTVQIVDGQGRVVATQSTNASAGVVTVSYVF